MFIIPTKSYQPLYNRAYTLEVKTDTLQGLQDAVYSNGSLSSPKHISDTTVAQAIPNIIGISDRAGTQVNIPYGWETSRFRFIMEVELVMGGQRFLHYYQGYSDNSDACSTNYVNPMATWFINSVSIVACTLNTVTGAMMYSGQMTYQLIRSESGLYMEELDRADKVLIRPIDVLKHMELTNKYVTDPSEILINHTNRTRNDIALINNRVNNNPFTYFSTVVNAVATPYSGLQVSGLENRLVTDKSALYSSAHRELQASGAQRFTDNFLNLLGQVTHRVRAEDFTISDLAKIDQDLQYKIKIIQPAQEVSSSFVTTEYTANTLAPSIENKIAINVASILPSLMSMYLLTKCNLSFSNAVGDNNLLVSGHSIFQGLNLPDAFNKLENRIKGSLIPNITQNGLVCVELEVDADLLGDTCINLSVNGQPYTQYRFPTFADGLYAPVITDSFTSQNINNDFQNLLGQVFNTDGIEDTTSQYTIPHVSEF